MHNVIWSAHGLKLVDNEITQNHTVWKVAGTAADAVRAAQVREVQHKLSGKLFRDLVLSWSLNRTVEPTSSSYESRRLIRGWQRVKGIIRRFLPRRCTAAIRKIYSGT
jgi:hypothetical protein